MERSNMFTRIENAFQMRKDRSIENYALESFLEVANCLSGLMFSDQDVLFTLVEGAKLGIASKNGKLGMEEKEFVDEAFGSVWDGDTSILYQIIAEPIDDKDYEMVEEMCKLSTEIAIKFVNCILAFAYIDGYANQRVLYKIDSIMSANLPVDFDAYIPNEFFVPYVRTHSLVNRFVELIENDAQKRAEIYTKIKAFLEMSRCEVRNVIGNLKHSKIQFPETNMSSVVFE